MRRILVVMLFAIAVLAVLALSEEPLDDSAFTGDWVNAIVANDTMGDYLIESLRIYTYGSEWRITIHIPAGLIDIEHTQKIHLYTETQESNLAVYARYEVNTSSYDLYAFVHATQGMLTMEVLVENSADSEFNYRIHEVFVRVPEEETEE